MKPDKVYWTKRIRNVTVHVKRRNSFPNDKFYVQVIKDTKLTCHTDYPIKLSDGKIAYDFPERIPKYAHQYIGIAFRYIQRLHNASRPLRDC